jgi:hypothetical protein
MVSTVRKLMLLAIVVGLPLGLCLGRRSEFLRRARWHESQTVELHATSFEFMKDPHTGRDIAFGKTWADERGRDLGHDEYLRLRRENDRHRALAVKYRRAADHLWLRIESDPSGQD